jgi:hypothetical protein
VGRVGILVCSLAIVATACAGDDRSGPVPTSAARSTTSTVVSTTTTTTTTTITATVTTSPSTPEDGVASFDVVTGDGEVLDASRERLILYRVYAPAGAAGPVPVILVSHGGTGSERGHRSAGHLGSTFATGGYLAIHVGHLPSTRPGQHRIDRPADISFVLDRLADGTLALPGGFEGEPDLQRVGHTGHSFGAYTSHAVAGATYDRTFTDERVDAIAPISPQGPDQFGAFDRGPDDNTWLTVALPAYNLVGGDEVDSNAVDTIVRPGWRLVPFERYPGTSDTFLTVIDGQDHRDMWSTGSDEVEQFVAEQILRFFDVYVRDDGTIDACTIGEGGLDGSTTRRRAAASETRLDDCT